MNALAVMVGDRTWMRAIPSCINNVNGTIFVPNGKISSSIGNW
jgi:hypothetical protein